MLIDVDGLEDKVKPQIKNARKYLELAKSSIENIYIPGDFSCSRSLRNIPRSILDIDARVSGIQNWLDTIIDDFSNVETKNKGLMNNLTYSVPIYAAMAGQTGSSVVNNVETINKGLTDRPIYSVPLYAMGGQVVKTGESTSSTVNSEGTVEGLKNAMSYIKNVLDYVFENDWITDSDAMEMKTAAVAVNVVNEVLHMGENIGDFLSATGATIANGTIGLVKGGCQLTGALIDAGAMLLAGARSIETGAADGISYLYHLARGETDNWKSITGEMWKETMGFVAKDHVNSAFKSFYTSTVVGQWLDENAVGIFKSDGIATNIISGLGYVAGIALLTYATLRNRYSSSRCFSSYNRHYNSNIYCICNSSRYR